MSQRCSGERRRGDSLLQKRREHHILQLLQVDIDHGGNDPDDIDIVRKIADGVDQTAGRSNKPGVPGLTPYRARVECIQSSGGGNAPAFEHDFEIGEHAGCPANPGLLSGSLESFKITGVDDRHFDIVRIDETVIAEDDELTLGWARHI